MTGLCPGASYQYEAYSSFRLPRRVYSLKQKLLRGTEYGQSVSNNFTSDGRIFSFLLLVWLEFWFFRCAWRRCCGSVVSGVVGEVVGRVSLGGVVRRVVGGVLGGVVGGVVGECDGGYHRETINVARITCLLSPL